MYKSQVAAWFDEQAPRCKTDGAVLAEVISRNNPATARLSSGRFLHGGYSAGRASVGTSYERAAIIISVSTRNRSGNTRGTQAELRLKQ